MESLLKACQNFNKLLPTWGEPEQVVRQISKNSSIRNHVENLSGLLNVCGEVHAPANPPPAPTSDQKFRAICWNIERGKNFPGILRTLQEHPQLYGADFYFLTEVDWGMARSKNRHVTAELGEALGYFAYFTPSYYNLSKGHGAERAADVENNMGLHGKALLSRYPLTHLRTVALPNCHDKLHSKESRIGQKRALLADLRVGSRTLTLAVSHLDAFSSPRGRRRQLFPAVETCRPLDHVLLGGDWNTNTLHSTSTWRLLFFLLYQIATVRPVKMIREHLPFPERRFDQPLFSMLQEEGFETDSCNHLGKGTYDLVRDNRELGQMASDQYPRWALKAINRLIVKAGGNMQFKLDWFASKNIRCLDRGVIRLEEGWGPKLSERASDHHPILLDFQLP
jgi:endonuclease/exonuclease/phosphatase family metal-dependent hydrolase